MGVSHSKLKKLSGHLNLHLFTILNPYQCDLDLCTPSSTTLNTSMHHNCFIIHYLFNLSYQFPVSLLFFQNVSVHTQINPAWLVCTHTAWLCPRAACSPLSKEETVCEDVTSEPIIPHLWHILYMVVQPLSLPQFVPAVCAERQAHSKICGMKWWANLTWDVGLTSKNSQSLRESDKIV